MEYRSWVNNMLRIDVEAAADNLKALLERVTQGEEIILMEQDKEVARLVPPSSRSHWLSRTRQFRESLQVTGESLSATVIDARQGERY